MGWLGTVLCSSDGTAGGTATYHRHLREGAKRDGQRQALAGEVFLLLFMHASMWRSQESCTWYLGLLKAKRTFVFLCLPAETASATSLWP